MGGWQSLPKWDRQYPPDWDEWGYRPYNSTPSQHVWSEWYQGDFKPPDPVGTAFPVLMGTTDDRLQNFGNVNSNNKRAAWWDGYTEYAPQYAHVINVPWDPQSDETMCTPDKYPNCSMQKMADNVKLTSWQNNAVVVGRPHVSTPEPGVPGTVVYNPVTTYAEAIDNLARHYASGGFDYLSQVNTNDTSAYDPCAGPSFFEIIMPLAIGGGMTLAVDRFGGTFLQTLPPSVQPVTMLCTFLFGFHYTRGALESILDPGSRDEDIAKAADAVAIALTYAAGAVVGDAYNNQYATEPSDAYSPIAGAVVALTVAPAIQPTILLAIKAGTFNGIALGLINVVVKGVSYFFCRLINWGADACEDSQVNPDARRWDVASLCAKLTNIACDREGWSKESAQAEFVFRALLTNPAWMYAANVSTNNPYVDMTGTNPLGSIVQVQTKNTGYYKADRGVFDYSIEEDKYSLSGLNMGGTFGSDNDTSYFACQNWDALFCDDDEDPSKCNVPDAGHKPETLLFAQNMKKWLNSAINAAYDPNNIRKMNEIPGLVRAGTKNRYDYDMDTYLQTCHKDFDEETGTGFDDVKERGVWAQHYDVSKVPPSPQKTQLLANSFFAYDNLAAAYEQLVNHTGWDERNMIAWAHYIYSEKGVYQTDTFDTWVGEGDPRVNGLLQKENTGFSANPWRSLIPLWPAPPLKPAHTPTTPLQSTWFERARQILEMIESDGSNKGLQEAALQIAEWTEVFNITYVWDNVPPPVIAFFAVVYGVQNYDGARHPDQNMQWLISLPNYPGLTDYVHHQMAYWMMLYGGSEFLTGTNQTTWVEWISYNYPKVPGFGMQDNDPISTPVKLQPPLVPDRTTPRDPLLPPEHVSTPYLPSQWDLRARQVEQLTSNGQGIEAVSDILTWTNGWNVQFVNTNVPPAVAAYFAVVIGISRTNSANALMQWVISNTMPYTPQEAQDYFLHQIAYWVGLIGNSEQLSGYWLQQWQTWNNYNFPKGPGF